MPTRLPVDATTEVVLKLVKGGFAYHFGALEPFWFGVTHSQAASAFAQFVENSLPTFGDYQDAMLLDQRFLFHSVIALYMKAGLLDPLTVCRRVEAAYRAGHAPLNAAAGQAEIVLCESLLGPRDPFRCVASARAAIGGKVYSCARTPQSQCRWVRLMTSEPELDELTPQQGQAAVYRAQCMSQSAVIRRL